MILFVALHLAVQSTTSIMTQSKLSRGHCGYRFVSCRDGSRCIPAPWDCDRFVDCMDRSDEDHCNLGVNASNTTGIFSCVFH